MDLRPALSCATDMAKILEHTITVDNNIELAPTIYVDWEADYEGSGPSYTWENPLDGNDEYKSYDEDEVIKIVGSDSPAWIAGDKEDIDNFKKEVVRLNDECKELEETTIIREYSYDVFKILNQYRGTCFYTIYEYIYPIIAKTLHKEIEYSLSITNEGLVVRGCVVASDGNKYFATIDKEAKFLKDLKFKAVDNRTEKCIDLHITGIIEELKNKSDKNKDQLKLLEEYI